MGATGWAALGVGLLLCFFGTWSVHLSVLASGFGLGWLLAEAFGGGPLTALLTAVAVALVSWVVVTFVLRAALFFIGALTGGGVGAKLYGLLETGDTSVLLAILVVLATAALGGLATNRFRRGLLAALCALGGAAIALSGVARIFPRAFDFLRTPDTTGWTIVAAAVWLLLAAAGWAVQRRRKPATAV